MLRGYGQYCPLSLAAELLCQKWTLVVISRILAGDRRFNAIQRGVPQMSPGLLARRLDELVRAGVLRTKRVGRWREYLVTPAGLELKPLIDGMAVWGQHWARDMSREDLDPAFLVWSMHTRMRVEAMPPGRIVIEFVFGGAPAHCEQFWLVAQNGRVEMCLKDPSLAVDLCVHAELLVFIEAWRGFRDVEAEIKAGRIRLSGDYELRKQFPAWLGRHVLASVPRLRRGRERRLAHTTGATRVGASRAG